MIRLILISIFIGALEARCDLINTQSAATDLYGIEIARVKNPAGSQDDQAVVVKFDRAKVGEALVLVVRNKEFKEFGEFEFDSQPTGSETGIGQARFSLNPEYLHRSYLKTEKHIIPLRLYFDAKGKGIVASKNTTIEATSSYSLKVWSVDVSFYKAQFGPPGKKQPAPLKPGVKPDFPQIKTHEELFRSWGLVPPEGSEFFSAGGKAAVVVRSTKSFLDELASELKGRGFLVEDKK